MRESFLLSNKRVTNFLIINAVLIIMAIGDVFFFIPSKITSGGLFGVAIILFHLLGVNGDATTYIGIFVFLLNIPLLFYSYFYFEKSYFNRSFYCTLTLPLIEAIIGKVIQFMNYKVLERNLYISLIVGTLIQGLCTAFIMCLGSSTGGLDIIARIVNRYFKKLSIGKIYIIFSFLIITSSLIVFDSKRVLASILSILAIGYLIDFSLEKIFKIKDINQNYRNKENI